MAFLDDSGVVDLVGCLKDKIAASFASKTELEGKQDKLVSGSTIKTVNSSSLLGSGNISVASSTHTHGSISNVGAITSDTTVASGDKLVIVDSSDSSKIKCSGIAFGSSASTFLRNDGTWAEPSSGGSITPSSTTPAMDGTAAVGTSTDYARADHVHPTDTSRQAALVSGTNIKTINNTSLLGSGNISIPTLPSVTASDNGKVLQVVNGTWAAVSLPSASGVSF